MHHYTSFMLILLIPERYVSDPPNGPLINPDPPSGARVPAIFDRSIDCVHAEHTLILLGKTEDALRS